MLVSGMLFVGLSLLCLASFRAADVIRGGGPLSQNLVGLLAIVSVPLLSLEMLSMGLLRALRILSTPPTAAIALAGSGTDLRGRVCVVSGCNTGVGKETAAGLASLGATVIMACRSRSKAEAAAEDIRQRLLAATGSADTVALAHAGRVYVEVLDLERLASVRDFASRFQKRWGHVGLHVLVCNAGLNSGERSADGLDVIFQVVAPAPAIYRSRWLHPTCSGPKLFVFGRNMVYGGSGFGGVVCWLSRQTTACRSTTVGSSLEVLRILYPPHGDT
jgi:hypothetical protein